MQTLDVRQRRSALRPRSKTADQLLLDQHSITPEKGGDDHDQALSHAFCGYAVLGLVVGGAITTDEVLKAEDARYATLTGNDFDSMQRLFEDDLVYIHSARAVDDKASYIERQRSNA